VNTIVAELPQLAVKLAAILGDSAFVLPAKLSLTSADLETLGHGQWSRTTDLKLSQLKAIADLGAKEPMAAALALPLRRLLSDRQVTQCAQRLDGAAVENPVLLGDVILTECLPAGERQEAILALVKRYPNSVIANMITARLYRSQSNVDEELRYAEKAVRLGTASPQTWLSLAHVYDNRAEVLRRGRTVGDITEEEWKLLNADYAKWLGATNRAVQLDQESSHAWTKLALACTFLSEKEMAYTAYDSALDLDPGNAEILRWGLQMFQPKWFDDEKRMEKLIERISTTDFDDGQVAAGMMSFYHSVELPTAPLADRFLKRQKALLAANPDVPVRLLSLAEFYTATERYDEAAPLYQKLLEMGVAREEYFAHALVAWRLAQKPAMAEALRLKRSALFFDAGSAVAAVAPQPKPPVSVAPKPEQQASAPATSASRATTAGGPPSKAAPAAAEIASLQDIQNKIQQSYSDKKYTECVKLYNEWISRDPATSGPRLAFGKFYQDIGNYEAAMGAGRAAVERDKTDESAFFLWNLLRYHGHEAEASRVGDLVKTKQKNTPQFYIGLGNDYLAGGHLVQAQLMVTYGVEALKHGVDPDNFEPDLYLLQGDIFAKQSKNTDAATAWKRAGLNARSTSPSVKVALQRVIDLQHSANKPEANAAAKSPPSPDAEVHYQRAQSARSQHSYDLAMLEIEEAIRLAPKNHYYHNLRANILLSTGKTNEALAEERTAEQVDDTDTELCMQYQMLRDIRWPEAVALVRQSRKPRAYLFMYVDILERLQDTGKLKDGGDIADMAVDIVQKTNPSGNQLQAVYVLKGDLLQEEGKAAEARVFWQKALDSVLKDDIWTARARTRLGVKAAAETPVPKLLPASDQDPTAAHRHWLQWRELSKTKDYAAAESEMRLAIQQDFYNAYYHYELAQWYSQSGRKQAALDQMHDSALVSNEDTYSYYLYEVLLAAGKKDEAIEAAKTGAQKEAHKFVQLYVVLGNYYLAKEDFGNVKKALDLGFEIQMGERKVDIVNPSLYLIQGDMLLKQGKKAEARDAWQKAVDYPNKDTDGVKEARFRLDANP
jgi:tetratricopeptide (TPR) repeat protein